MTYLAKQEEMDDANFCRRKESDYFARALAANNPALRFAYEAAAREYAYRATEIEKNQQRS